MSENIKQKRLTILEYFDAYIYHHYEPNGLVLLLMFFFSTLLIVKSEQIVVLTKEEEYLVNIFSQMELSTLASIGFYLEQIFFSRK